MGRKLVGGQGSGEDVSATGARQSKLFRADAG